MKKSIIWICTNQVIVQNATCQFYYYYYCCFFFWVSTLSNGSFELAIIGNLFFKTPNTLSITLRKNACQKLNNSLGVCGGFLERHISFYSLVPIPKFAIHVSFDYLVYSSNKIIPWQHSYYNPWLRGKKKKNHIIKLT